MINQFIRIHREPLYALPVGLKETNLAFSSKHFYPSWEQKTYAYDTQRTE